MWVKQVLAGRSCVMHAGRAFVKVEALETVGRSPATPQRQFHVSPFACCCCVVAIAAYCLCRGINRRVVCRSIQLLQQRSQAFQGRAAAGLLQDDSALALAGELYVAHCAACHGNTGAESERGVPQLENAMFHHGESEAEIRTTIREGRHSVMPSFGGEMSEVELGTVVAYVRSFSSGESLANYAETAEEQFGKYCVQCHGAEGLGNVETGIPNLADDYWLHGESMMNVRLTITGGVDVQCPPQAGLLADSEIELLTAHVLGTRSSSVP